MISFNMLEAARQAGVKRFFYASSACIYPEYSQLDTQIEGGGLKEAEAWPAQPQVTWAQKEAGTAGTSRKANLSQTFLSLSQDAYGLEKLATEELAMHYNKDFGMETRIARFHNIYGPYGKGGISVSPWCLCCVLGMAVLAK